MDLDHDMFNGALKLYLWVNNCFIITSTAGLAIEVCCYKPLLSISSSLLSFFLSPQLKLITVNIQFNLFFGETLELCL